MATNKPTVKHAGFAQFLSSSYKDEPISMLVGPDSYVKSILGEYTKKPLTGLVYVSNQTDFFTSHLGSVVVFCAEDAQQILDKKQIIYSLTDALNSVFDIESTNVYYTKRSVADLENVDVISGKTFIADISALNLDQLVHTERNGFSSKEFLSVIQKLKLPNSRVLEFLKIPKSTAAYKIKSGARFEGTEALATLRITKLLAKAEEITANSLHPDAKNFDSGKWLGEWLESPQPALGGKKPSELLDTEAGGNRVFQVLSALESGSYQ